MKWFIPSWNGDLRLEPDEGDPEGKTMLVIERPTPHEVEVLGAIGKSMLELGYVDAWDAKLARLRKSKRVTINASLEKVGPIVSKLMRPGKAVLTAIRFEGGRVITSHGDVSELQAIAEEAKKEEKGGKDKPAAAATVKRPTPCCPQCEPGSIGPAREVLLSFLSEEEHETWRDGRFIIIEGGLSGHRYLLAHRHTPLAACIGRVCFDLDDEAVIHFHDRSVPPEEEILAAKLILEHREPWLRNEATHFGAWGGSVVPDHPGGVERFKNPFGDVMDGTESAALTTSIGTAALFALSGAKVS